MKVDKISEVTDADILFESGQSRSIEFEHVVAADLMSEIMLDTIDNSVMVTGLINPQVIRTAEMMDVFAVIFVRGKDISPAVLDLAKDRGIAVMSTKISMYEACGRLYEAGLTSGQQGRK